MKIIKFLGKVLALPFSVVLTTVLVGLIPLRIIVNWLSGYGKYNKLYWKFSKYTILHALASIKRGWKPMLTNVIWYSDDLESVLFENNKKDPQIIHIGKR